MHIDVNNAFLSWSAIDLLNKGYKKDIRDIIAVIGGDEKTRSGIVLAKSNPAKKCGIVTAETLYSARKKATNLQVFPPNYEWYSKESKELFNLLNKYSPDIEVASIDECYLDYGKVKMLYGDPIKFAYKIKDEIKNTLGFTVNVGIANNKLCAKMASDFSKPDKVHTCFKDEVESKMYPLPIRELFGIGKKMSEKLISVDINTIGDLANSNYEFLSHYFKRPNDLINLAKGIDDSEVISEKYSPDSISNEITLKTDVTDIPKLQSELEWLCEYASSRLRKEGKYANTICVILKDSFFKRKNHQKKISSPTNITSEIYREAVCVLKEMYNGYPVRLIGIRLDDLTSKKYYQTSLFDNISSRENDSKVDKVMDDINKKFGYNTIKKASLLDNNHKIKKK